MNQDPGDGSTVDSGLGTVTMEEEDAKANTAGDEKVKGGDREAAIDVTLDVNATDDLVWNANDPYFKKVWQCTGLPLQHQHHCQPLLKRLFSCLLHLQATRSFAGKSQLWSQNQ